MLVNLGLWQLQRLEERRALNREIWAGLNQPAAALSGAETDPGALHFRRVTATGTFDNAESIVLRNRSFQGRPGVHLITPLRLDGSDKAILVDRGWIPMEDSDPETRRVYDLEGEATVAGVARRGQTRPDSFFAPTDPMPKPGEQRLDAWFRVDIERIQAQVSAPLLPIFIEQTPLATPPSAPPIPEENTDLSDGPHLGYALQWFSFALILIVVYAGFTWQEYKGGEKDV